MSVMSCRLAVTLCIVAFRVGVVCGGLKVVPSCS